MTLYAISWTVPWNRGRANGHGTVVITAGPGYIQWLAMREGVFHIEVHDPAGHRRRGGLLGRLRGRKAADTTGYTDRELALLTDLGFVAGNPNYELRPDDRGLDRDHTVYVITTVLHDIFAIRDPGDFSAEIF